MVFVPLHQARTDCFRNIHLVATDMDGTLTQLGKFTSGLLKALEDLGKVGVPVLIVTGRSAGWVSGLASLMPIAGVIAENGGLFYPSTGEIPVALTSIPNLVDHRKQLAHAFEQLKSKFSKIQESVDNRFRITDWTFDNCQLTDADLKILEAFCHQLGWGFTYSSVQCHIKPASQDKSAGLLKVLRDYFPQYTSEQVITVGDSPNDESLFDPSCFPVSVGVANVLEYADQLRYQPAYVTTAEEAEGFCELAGCLLKSSAGEIHSADS